MMILYSGSTCPFSQRCRIVLHEKGMDFQIIPVELHNKPEEIEKYVGDKELPVLVERDLVLTQSNIINEYIDERFPHPQLMPADPMMRARARLFLHEFEKTLFESVRVLENPSKHSQKAVDKARGGIREILTQIAPVFNKQKYMLGDDDITMVDVALAPLLWRLEHYNIKLPEQAAPILKYAERIFSRTAFIEALTASEKAMRK